MDRGEFGSLFQIGNLKYRKIWRDVTKADVISKILLTPYNLNDSWSFYATYIRGAVYMMSFRKEFPVQAGDLFYNWGHKFKQYMCGGNITEGFCPNEQYRIVLTSKLGPYDVLYHKAVDCVKSGTISGQKKLSDYVNVYQTTRTDKPDPTNYFERFKTFNWVVPMVMGGLDETIVGFTNKKKGRVEEVRLYTENDLKEKGKGHWNLDKNFTFAVDFLKFVKEKTKSIPGEVFFFQRRKNQNIVTCLKGEKKFVPDWFVKMLETSGVEKLETSDLDFQGFQGPLGLRFIKHWFYILGFILVLIFIFNIISFCDSLKFF